MMAKITDRNYKEINKLFYPNVQNVKIVENKSLGRYGQMAANYLKEEYPDRYKELFQLDLLEQIMLEVNIEVWRQIDRYVEEYLERYIADSGNTMKMCHLRMEAIQTAEELILPEVVYQFR